MTEQSTYTDVEIEAAVMDVLDKIAQQGEEINYETGPSPLDVSGRVLARLRGE